MRGTAHGFSPLRPDVHWSQLTPCKHDPDAMFPMPKDGSGIAAARRVCAPCEFKLECLQEGIEKRDWTSVRAGHTGYEREKLHRANIALDLYPQPGQPFSRKPWHEPRECVTCNEDFVPGQYRMTALHCVDCQPSRYRKKGECARCNQTKLLHARKLCEACYSTLRRQHGGPDFGSVPGVPPVKVRRCGTEAAYERHRTRGEEPCDDCKAFMRGLWAERRAGAAAKEALSCAPVEVSRAIA